MSFASIWSFSPSFLSRAASILGTAIFSVAFGFGSSFAADETPDCDVSDAEPTSVDRATSDLGSVEAETFADRVRVRFDGRFFADYRFDYKGTPIIWPICAADQTLVTRAWPMIDDVDVDAVSNAEMKEIYQNARLGERGGAKDHPHHRSLWFNHGAVNGGDFWGGTPATIRQTELLDVETGERTIDDELRRIVKIRTKNRWFNDKQNRDVCEDERTIIFGTLPKEPNVRYIDFDVVITALEDGVVFGDTKEGSFGIRMPSPTALTAKKSNPNWGGSILDNLGNKDGDAWSKRAIWVEYSGPAAKFLSGDALQTELKKGDDATDFPLTTISVSVINASDSWAYPSWRHVRDYGLFATNPFGQRDFEPQNADADGSVKLNEGETLTFAYRVLIAPGELSPETLEAATADFERSRAFLTNATK